MTSPYSVMSVSHFLSSDLDEIGLLFATGFGYSAATVIGHADTQWPHQHRSNLHSLRPMEEGRQKNLQLQCWRLVAAVGGVYATRNCGSLRLFPLGSALRGIPCKELRGSLPVGFPLSYGYYPGADAITFVELAGVRYVHWPWESTLRVHSKTTAIPSEDHLWGRMSSCHMVPKNPLSAVRMRGCVTYR